MNIKIGKGGSGKINSTKGGTSKLNQKKYIDLLPVVSIPSIDTVDGLIAFWDLDNANGLSTIPASYGSFTLNTYGDYSSVNGKIKNGFGFTDSSQGLWTNEQLWNLLTNPTSFSVSYWIKLPDVSSAITLMGNAFGNLGFHFDYINDDSFYGGSNYGFNMNMSTVGGPYAWERTFAKELAVANQWYHIVGTYDYPTTTMRLYVNGVLKDTNTNAIIGENSLPDLGGFAINGSVLDGYKEYGANEIYDAIGFWNKTLNQNEISSLYNNGNGKQFSTVYNLTFLFDPIFYKREIQNERYKILVEGCSLDYVNGIYTQTVNPSLINNRPYFYKDDDPTMEIFFDGTNWVIGDASERDGYGYELFYKIEFPYSAPSNQRPDFQGWVIGGVIDGGGAMEFETSPGITTYSTNILGYGGDLDPAYMEELRSYQIDGVIPTFPNIDVRQHIPGSSFNSRKAEFSGNVFKYTKYNNNDDVPHLKTHGKQFYDTLNRGRGPEVGKNLKDNKYSFLFLRRNDFGTMFSSTSSSTLNFFIKLQRPVSHTSPSNYVVREKRGIFLTSYADINRPLTVGYRSPYYNINGDNTYKYKFEPFSFVFSFGQTYTSEFGLANFCVMTDYKYKFGEMYMLTIRWDLGQLYIYVNGEQQTTALLPFNPCYFPSSSNCRNRRQHQERINYIPLAPGFLKKNGSTYTMTASLWEPASSNGALHNYLCFGRSPRGQNQFDTVHNGYKRKRYLNNLEAGVIMSYNVPLSPSQISQIYENFRYRYI